MKISMVGNPLLMKNSIFFVLALTVAMVAASCERVDEIVSEEDFFMAQEPQCYTFTASLGVSTKTIRDAQGAVSWAAGDKLMVFDASGNHEEFTVNKNCEEFTFTSTGTLQEGPYYAIAGYGSQTPTFDVVNKTISIVPPAIDGSFASADVIASTAEQGSNTFCFHHVYAILKLTLSTTSYASVEFVAGGIAPGSSTVIGFGVSGSLDVQSGQAADKAVISGTSDGGTFYIPVNPGEYSAGFSIILNTGTVRWKIESSKTLTTTAGRIMDFGTLENRPMVETSAFLEKKEYGAYSYNSSTDELSSLYEYDVRNGQPSVGSDQYAVSAGKFRIQSLDDGMLASFTFPTTLTEGSTVAVTTLSYGVNGLTDGTDQYIVKKISDGNVWLSKENGSLGLVVPTN